MSTGGETLPIWNGDKSPKQLMPVEFPKYKKDDPLPTIEFKLTATAKSIGGKVCPFNGDNFGQIPLISFQVWRQSCWKHAGLAALTGYQSCSTRLETCPGQGRGVKRLDTLLRSLISGDVLWATG